MVTACATCATVIIAGGMVPAGPHKSGLLGSIPWPATEEIAGDMVRAGSDKAGRLVRFRSLQLAESVRGVTAARWASNPDVRVQIPPDALTTVPNLKGIQTGNVSTPNRN